MSSRIENILQAIIDNTSYDKLPQSRIEEILLAIKNNTQYSALPQSRIESLLLAIKNNDDYDKLPQSRIEEILLAKIKQIEYKKPAQSKIEKLLIKWLYQDLYITLFGTPPLTFTSDGSPLVDYTIYGAAGGVGDKTKNLANVNTMLQGYFAFANGSYISSGSWVCTQKTTCKSDTDYTFHFENQSRAYGIVWWDTDGNYISSNSFFQIAKPVTFTARSPVNAAIMSVQVAGKATTTDQIRKTDMVDFQVEENSTATDYEPYGYKIPITCGGVTTNIYLDSPLYEGESISFSTAGVEIPTAEGENTLTVGTTVQPSNLEITYVPKEPELKFMMKKKFEVRR